jgi:hypothetical protein
MYNKWLTDWMSVLVDICPNLVKFWKYSSGRICVLAVATIHIRTFKILIPHFCKIDYFPRVVSANTVKGPDVASEMTATTLVSAVRCERLHCHVEGSHIAIKFVSGPEEKRRMSPVSE